VAANEAKIVITADDKASGSIDGIAGKARQLRGAFLAVGAAGAAVTGAFGLSVKTFAQTGDEIQKMALRTGLTTESLSELKFALEQSGSSIEGFEKGIRRMASFIQDGRDGLTETTRALDSLGIAVTDFDGLSPEQSFDLLANALAGVEDNLVQSALAQDIFGRAGTSLIPLLEQGTDGIEALRKEAEALGIVFDQDAADAAARLVDAQNTLSKSFQGVQIAIAEGLAPALSGFLEGAAKVLSKISEWAKENPALTKIIVGFTGALGVLALAVGAIGLALPIVATGLGAVSIGFIGLNVATGGLIIAIGAIGAGLVLLVTEWDAVVATFKKGVNFLIGLAEKYANTWILALNKIIDGINALGSVFGVEIEKIAEIEIPRLTESIEEAADAIEENNDGVIESNQMLADSFTSLADDAMTFAENLVASSEERYEELKEQRWQNVEDEKAALEAEAIAREEHNQRMLEGIEAFWTAKQAKSKEEFDELVASMRALPEVIQTGSVIGAHAMQAFKDSQNNLQRQLDEARAQLAQGDFGNGLFWTSEEGLLAEIKRLEDMQESGKASGAKLGELILAARGHKLGGAPPMLPELNVLGSDSVEMNQNPTQFVRGENGMQREAVFGNTYVVNGDVYGFEDFADKVEQAQTQNRDAGAIR
jgi:TP901 family phage tail tape measure protein